jgi:hypothetical protein
MQDVDDWRNASAKYCNNNNHGHLLSIETEDEKNFITKEFLLAGFGRTSLTEIIFHFVYLDSFK